MIGIAGIGYVLGAQRIDNAKRNITEPELLEKKIGVHQIARRDSGQDTSDLALAAVDHLLTRHPFDLKSIECVIVVTQNPDGFGLPHTSAIVHGKLGLSESCAAFDISLGCSGFVYGLSAITAFMSQNSMTNGLLITADPYSKVIDDTDRNTSLLFGDGAAATLISDHPAWLAGRFVFGTVGKQGDALRINEHRKLEMDGRTVFTFSATAVPPAIRETLIANNMTMDDIDCVLLHQGSKFIVDTIAKRLEVTNKTKFYAGEYGNTVSSSLPILLADNVAENTNTILISGFGVGLSLGCTVLRRVAHAY